MLINDTQAADTWSNTYTVGRPVFRNTVQVKYAMKHFQGLSIFKSNGLLLF